MKKTLILLAASSVFVTPVMAEPQIVSISVHVPDFQSLQLAQQDSAASTFAYTGREPSVMLSVPETSGEDGQPLVMYAHNNSSFRVSVGFPGDGGSSFLTASDETAMQNYVRQSFALSPLLKGKSVTGRSQGYTHIVVSAQ
ncbi:MAG: hypothetical protein RIB03_12830 [Henriciella sp.]|uniref:hypothetical protein n=1 Tax=Henriciella sp. TaxID=1968823 RepID=UPI0032ED73AE